LQLGKKKKRFKNLKGRFDRLPEAEKTFTTD